MMQEGKFRHLLLVVKGVIGKWWKIIGKYKVIQQRKLIRFLLLPAGIICVTVIVLVIPLNYTPSTSVLFPYIPPPPKGYYFNMTNRELSAIISGMPAYGIPEVDPNIFILESFIFKDIIITSKSIVTRKIEPYIVGEGLASPKTETFIINGNLQFVPQDPSDLKELKVGDVVDIICVCAGMSKEWPSVVVFRNCQFLPAGVAPLPLPGGPAPITGGY